MSQPPDKYDRIFDFTDFSAMQPSAQQPGQKIDQELNAARVSINETIDRLNEIQRDDGKLRATAVDTSEFQGIVDTATATATAAATSASTSATTATTKAGEATASATTASNAATAATGASATAQAQATIASTSATTATTKATEASNSAASALASQTSATASAATATTKAAEASGSAATATTQASNAQNSANTSSAQANLATASAVAAGNSASTSSAQAIAAANSASAASSSASSAAASAASIMALDPVEEAPTDGTQYARKDGAWEAVPVVDISGKANLSGASFTGKVSTAASTASTAGFRITPGVLTMSTVAGDFIVDSNNGNLSFHHPVLGINHVPVFPQITAYVDSKPASALSSGDVSSLSGASYVDITASATATISHPGGNLYFYDSAPGSDQKTINFVEGSSFNLSETTGPDAWTITIETVAGGGDDPSVGNLVSFLASSGSTLTVGFSGNLGDSLDAAGLFAQTLTLFKPTISPQGSEDVAFEGGFGSYLFNHGKGYGAANGDVPVYSVTNPLGILWSKPWQSEGYSKLNSPIFTGTPSLPTGTTAVTQSAGNNTTALATTAFVTAAIPAFATDAQAIAGTSATTIINPADYRVAGLTTNIWAPGYINMTGGTSGTGASTGATALVLSGAITAPNALTAGYATRGFYLHYPSNSVTTGYNFGTASGHATRFYSLNLANTLAGIKVRAVFGRANPTIPVPTTLAVRGYGWEWDWSTRTLSIIAHNGTALTTTAVTWNPVNARTYEMTVTSDGAGTIALYVDGVLLGTSSGGPTGAINTTNPIWWQAEIQNEATAAFQATIHITNTKIYTTNG